MLSLKQYLTEVHYSDLWGKNFDAMRKKYLKVKKESGVEDLYVQFTNYADHMNRNPFTGGDKRKVDHSDMFAIFAYPMDYLLTHPADIWYGFNSKYMRVLKKSKSAKVLELQAISEVQVQNWITKIPQTKNESPSMLITRIEKWLKKYGRNIVSPGAVFFFIVQHKVEEEPKKDDYNKPRYEVRTSDEQSKILLDLGYNAVEDTAKNNRRAIINDREPEQIAFLRRDALEIVEIFNLNTKSEYTKTTNDLDASERKLVADICVILDDKIKTGPERANNMGWSFYWTVKGRRIEIDFTKEGSPGMMSGSAPTGYFKNLKWGEKKHRNAKLYSWDEVEIKIKSELGNIHIGWDKKVKFSEVLDDIRVDWDSLKQKNKKSSWKPETKDSHLQNRETDRTSHYHLEWLKLEQVRMTPEELEFAKKKFGEKASGYFATGLDIENREYGVARLYHKVKEFVDNAEQDALDDHERGLVESIYAKLLKTLENNKLLFRGKYATVEEAGVKIQSEVPVTINYVRNTEKSPNMGSRFQQDIEPAGKFFLHDLYPDTPAPKGWEKGQIELKCPLLLWFNQNHTSSYDEHSWKAVLSKIYDGKKGKALSSAIKQDGYDSIVTIKRNDKEDEETGLYQKETSEIVKLA